jgi:hypothetical protein
MRKSCDRCQLLSHSAEEAAEHIQMPRVAETQATAIDAKRSSGGSSTKWRQFSQSSRRSWLTLAAETRNTRATQRVGSPFDARST